MSSNPFQFVPEIKRGALSAALALLTTILVGGCTASETAPVGFETTDSAGVTLVRNPAEPWDSSLAPRLTPDLRIGVIEGEPEYQFAQIFDVAEGSGGQIYVLDRTVGVFDPSGQHVRTIGRRGDGPGEIQTGVRLRVSPGDTLYVLEGGGRRLHTVAPDGRLIETRAFAAGLGLVREAAVAPTGEVLLQASERGPDGARLDVLLLLDFATQTVDTLHELQPARAEVPVVYSGTPAWALLEDGRLVVGRSDEYRFEFLRPDGTVERVMTRDVAPRPITDSEKAAILESRRGQTMSPFPSTAPQTVADAFPHYAHVMPGPRSTLWVLRHPIPAAAGGPADRMETWDVFAADGQLMGPVQLEVSFPRPSAGSEHIYQVVRDELGVPYVQRFRIDWGEGG